jgi:hypothetical protein
MGHEPNHFWREAVPVEVSIPLTVVFLVTC